MVQKKQPGLMVSQKNEEELDAFLSGKSKAAPVRGTRRAKSEPAGPWFASYLATGGVLAFFTLVIFHGNGIAGGGDVRGAAVHQYDVATDGILDFDDIYDDDGVNFDDDYYDDKIQEYDANLFVDDYYDDDILLDDGGYYNDAYMNNGTPLGEVCLVDADCTSVSCFMADVGFSYCHCTVCDTGGCGGCGMGKHCQSFTNMLPNVCVGVHEGIPPGAAAPGAGAPHAEPHDALSHAAHAHEELSHGAVAPATDAGNDADHDSGRMRRAASTRGGPTEAAQHRRRRGSTPHRS